MFSIVPVACPRPIFTPDGFRSTRGEDLLPLVDGVVECAHDDRQVGLARLELQRSARRLVVRSGVCGSVDRQVVDAHVAVDGAAQGDEESQCLIHALFRARIGDRDGERARDGPGACVRDDAPVGGADGAGLLAGCAKRERDCYCVVRRRTDGDLP